uniref:Uncharacterized protein n=1 Tax=Ciona intestinalis TaxID=7719 RepID=F6WC65_CIOIN
MARNGGYSEREMRQQQEDAEQRLKTRNVRKKLLDNLQVADVLPLLSEVIPANKKLTNITGGNRMYFNSKWKNKGSG